MTPVFDSIEAWAPQWTAFVSRALTDGTVAFVVVICLWIALRRWLSASVGYLLFGLVLLKIANPFELAGPSWLAWMSPANWVTSEPVARVPVMVPDAAVYYTLTPVPYDRALSTTEWLFVAWAVIASILLVRLGFQQWRIGRIVRAARPLRDGEVDLDLARLQRLSKVGRRVRWLVTDEVESPATGGLLRPFVLLPRGLTRAIEPAALRWVLLHELAHVRRGDVHVALVQRIVSIALFFHPLVWWTNRLIDEQREFACDDAALAISGSRRKECGEGFLSVVEWVRHRGVSGPAGAMAMFDNKSTIRRRLMNIIEGTRPKSRMQRVFGGVLALAVATFVLPTSRAEAAEADLASMQDPGERRSADRELRKLQRKLEKLQKRQDELMREIEAFRRSARQPSSGSFGIRAREEAPRRSKGVFFLEDVTDGDGGPSAPKSGKGSVIFLDDVTHGEEPSAPKSGGRLKLGGDGGRGSVTIYSRTDGPFGAIEVEEVEEVFEESCPDAPEVAEECEEGEVSFGFFTTEAVEEVIEEDIEVEAPSVGAFVEIERTAPEVRFRRKARTGSGSDSVPEPRSPRRAVIRSNGDTRVIDLDGLPSSGVIEIGGQKFRYERAREAAPGPQPPRKPKASTGRFMKVHGAPPRAETPARPETSPDPVRAIRTRRASGAR